MGLTSTPPSSFEQCVPKDYCVLREQKTKEYVDLKIDKCEETLNKRIDDLRDYVDEEIAGTYAHRERTVIQLNGDMKSMRDAIDDFKTQMLWVSLAGNATILAAIVTLFAVLK
jgi:hypothetical protein